MTDKQTSALILLFVLSFVFYLYNTGKLKPVIDKIIAPPGTGGTDFGGSGYEERGPGFDWGGDGTYLPPVGSAGSPNYPGLANGQISRFVPAASDGFYNTLNTLELWNWPVINYARPIENGLPNGVGGYL